MFFASTSTFLNLIALIALKSPPVQAYSTCYHALQRDPHGTDWGRIVYSDGFAYISNVTLGPVPGKVKFYAYFSGDWNTKWTVEPAPPAEPIPGWGSNLPTIAVNNAAQNGLQPVLIGHTFPAGYDNRNFSDGYGFLFWDNTDPYYKTDWRAVPTSTHGVSQLFTYNSYPESYNMSGVDVYYGPCNVEYTK